MISRCQCCLDGPLSLHVAQRTAVRVMQPRPEPLYLGQQALALRQLARSHRRLRTRREGP